MVPCDAIYAFGLNCLKYEEHGKVERLFYFVLEGKYFEYNFISMKDGKNYCKAHFNRTEALKGRNYLQVVSVLVTELAEK